MTREIRQKWTQILLVPEFSCMVLSQLSIEWCEADTIHDRHPQSLKNCVIKPRSSAAENLIKRLDVVEEVVF